MHFDSAYTSTNNNAQTTENISKRQTITELQYVKHIHILKIYPKM